MSNRAFLVLLVAVVAGCSTTPAVDESLGEESISGVSMSCKKPYELPQDCSIWSGATRKIEIEGFPVKIAGSSDGNIVLVMDAHIFGNAFKEGITLNLAEDYQTVAANNSYEAVQKALNKNGVTISQVRPVVTLGRINGYVLVLASDGYTGLTEYSVE